MDLGLFPFFQGVELVGLPISLFPTGLTKPSLGAVGCNNEAPKKNRTTTCRRQAAWPCPKSATSMAIHGLRELWQGGTLEALGAPRSQDTRIARRSFRRACSVLFRPRRRLGPVFTRKGEKESRGEVRAAEVRGNHPASNVQKDIGLGARTRWTRGCRCVSTMHDDGFRYQSGLVRGRRRFGVPPRCTENLFQLFTHNLPHKKVHIEQRAHAQLRTT